MKAWSAIRRTVAPSIRPARMLLALKTAIAAGLAWPIAQLLPGAVDEYSYYAPLGALISMMPTLMGSLKASLQTALGLAIGIGLSWLIILSPLPGAVSVPLTVGLGVLVGGLRGLGAGRDYVPIAALFVLVIGGSQIEDYSVGYLVQMAVGMVIGIIVNLVLVPPLHVRDAARQIDELRTQVAENLDSLAIVMDESWPPDDENWGTGSQNLDAAISAAEPVVEEALEGRRLNPRARWHRQDLQQDVDNFTAIRAIARDVRDLGEAIRGAISGEPTPVGLPDTLREPLVDAISSTADLIRAWNSHEGEQDALSAVDEALDRLRAAGLELPPNESGDGGIGAILFFLRRAIGAIRERLDLPRA